MVRLKTVLGSNKRKVLITSFVLSNFKYCLLVWFVSSFESLRKTEKLHKRALIFLLNHYVSFNKQLSQKSSKTSVNLRNHKALCNEVFKTIIDLNSTYMKEILSTVSNKRPIRRNHKMNLITPKTNKIIYGTKSLRNLAIKIWSSLTVRIKSSENLRYFKGLIQVWEGTPCNISIQVGFWFYFYALVCFIGTVMQI